MARTPLLRALQRLADEHRRADALGIPVEDMHERDATISRREFLKRSAVVGVAASAGPLAFSSPAKAANQPRIAIVGAGIAGLCAALQLQDNGIYADVYEASGRVGGRMHSDWQEFGHGFWDNGQQAELCGELIDSAHTTILGLAQRFGLTVADLLAAQPKGTDDTNWIFGSDYTLKQASEDFKPVNKVLQQQLKQAPFPTLYNSYTPAGQTLDQLSVHDWIAQYVPGGLSSRMGALLNAAYNEEYGAETTDQSSLNLVYLLGFQPKGPGFAVLGQSDERYHIAGGNSLLPAAIAAALSPAALHTNHRLTAIALNRDGSIRLSFDHGKDVTADHVILSTSFAVLRTLDYSKAGFDQLKQTAITQLGAGRNAKLNVQFSSRLWNAQGSTGSLYSDQPFQAGWDVTRAQAGATGILVEYPGANTAQSMAQTNPYSTTASNPQVATYAKQFLTQLEPVFPGITKQWNGKAMLSTPFTDPNLLCSYAYWKPGQYVGFSGYEGARQGNVHFAGEHCSTNFQGFMEGAAEEGQRAANEILADLKKV
ncbi:MAG: FAD-dependent oxidoreductase [Actinobacteria bacterium]|nr:FAD-dependent oxidoreductase [Actinomycetota bacterium]